MISARLSSLSCNENVFLSEAPIYNDALKSKIVTKAPKRNAIGLEKLFGSTLHSAKL